MADPGPGPGPTSTVWQTPTGAGAGPRGTDRGALRRDAVAVLGCLLVLGVLCGVAWSLLVSPAEFTKLRNGASMSEVQLGRRFAADGLYVVLAGVAGLVAGVALTWWRSRDPLLTSVLLVVGSALAAAAMALTGHLLGPGDTAAALAAVPVGAHVPEPLDVDVFTVYLAWPIALLAGVLLVLLGRVPDTDR